MTIPVGARRESLQVWYARAAPDANLSVPLAFGLGAGLYFEYFTRAHETPSRFFIGFNRNCLERFNARRETFQHGAARQIVREALRENALQFNLDRAPTTALMGMEMLAEQLADFSTIPDWKICLREMRAEITGTDSCYRRTYLQFLHEVSTHLATQSLCAELDEIADEWDALAAQLTSALQDATQLESAARKLRRIAFREEHFWGKVLDL